MFTKVSNDDWQYLFPFLIIILVFIATDILGFIRKVDFAYSSGMLLLQPYRAITSHFLHADFNHLLANTFGIAVARFLFKELSLKNKYFFITLILLLIPLQSFLQWSIDIFLFKNPRSLLLGFSGLLYGIDAFILLSSIYGKKHILGFEIGLVSNSDVTRIVLILTTLGFVFSLLPRISFIGHLTGFAGGLILFVL